MIRIYLAVIEQCSFYPDSPGTLKSGVLSEESRESYQEIDLSIGGETGWFYLKLSYNLLICWSLSTECSVSGSTRNRLSHMSQVSAVLFSAWRYYNDNRVAAALLSTAALLATPSSLARLQPTLCYNVVTLQPPSRDGPPESQFPYTVLKERVD
jgi:hypothetical protein